MGSDQTSKNKWTNDLKDKELVARESLLITLRKIDHYRSVLNVFAVVLMTAFLSTMVNNYLDTGSVNIGFKVLSRSLENFSAVLRIWILMQFSTVLFYLGYRTWAHRRHECSSKSYPLHFVDTMSGFVFVIYIIAFIVVPAKLMFRDYIAPLASMLLLIEQLRMLMKKYAFVRSTAPRIMDRDSHYEKGKKFYRPEFSKFVYFLFAPTLVYRDEYPRNAHIRWRFVAIHFVEVVISIFYLGFVFEHFILMQYDELGVENFTPKAFIVSVFNTMIPSLVTYFVAFYLVFHGWHNFFGELLRFADRLFYKDWWNSNGIDNYFRKWNVIVHDWLYTYIYKDAYEKLHNKMYAKYIVFFVSAVMHEYVFALSFRIFFPLMLLIFANVGLRVSLGIGNAPDENLSLWFGHVMGNGFIFTLYIMENYAKTYCLSRSDSFYDILVPKSWNCYPNTAYTQQT